MKWMKRISIWIVVSLSIQGLILFYLNHYFSPTDSKVISKKVDENKNEKEKKIDIIVPPKAKNILVSYDARYLSYYENDELKIVNCKNGSVKNIEGEEESKISFYEWLPDRNRMLLVEKKSYDASSHLVLYYYDVSKGEKVQVKNLALGDSTSEVQDIQLSTLTGVTYIKVSSKGGRSSIYRIDRMGNVTQIRTIPNFISNIALARHKDKLVYEGLVYNSIYVTGSDESISIKEVEKLTLIGADNDDNAYLGELKNNKIEKIYYGQTTENTDEWKSYDLQIPCEKDDLFISSEGKVYQNDALRGVIKEISSGTQTSYKGKLLQLYTKGIVSLLNDKITFASFK